MGVRTTRAGSKKIRRVVTGHTPEGKSVLVSDGTPPRTVVIPGIKDSSITAVWATDYGMSALPGSDDPTPAMTTFVPNSGGTRFLVTVAPPAGQGLEPGTDLAAVAKEMLTKLPGLAQAMEPDNPGMHTTDTVDYDIIISGDVSLELDDGQEVHLKAGDIVIQNGTRHRWRNTGKKPCVVYSVLVGVPRR
jgi:mannose-6-phosphate isomerase-like protein (cupin superfamily)